MGGLTRQVLEPSRALADTFKNPGLRRLQLAWAGSILGTWAYLVALFVYAYAKGGPGAVALVAVIRVLPAAIVAPITSSLADRFPRRLVMIGSDLVSTALMAGAAAVIAFDGPAWIVYAVVGLTTITGTPFRPAQAALIPALARTPAELTAANVASSTLESVGTFAGPALGGLLLAATTPQLVFAVNAATFLWSASLALGIRVTEPPRGGELEAGAGFDLVAGVRTILRDRNVGLLTALYAAQTLVAGALGVLVVVTVFRLVHGGDADVGLLNAAIGVGGIVGSVVTLALTARNKLAADFGLGLALFGALAVIGLWPHLGVAFAALAVLGLGNSLVDITAVTLLQRTVADEVLGRVLGVLEGILLASLGLGALAAPLLVDAFGPRTALIAAGATLPALVLLAAPRLRTLDSTLLAPPLTALLRRVDILSPLPPATLERLAGSLLEVRVPGGETVIRAGDTGDRFYVVGEGEVEIEGRRFGPGSGFGEIALLRDVPRTATVTAATDVLLYALEREDFLAAVTGHEPSRAVADTVIARRLGELRVERADPGVVLTTGAGAA
jgi:MFS family permease